jgi:hypothetical protein
MDAASIVVGWKKRLIVMAENPPYVFRNTPPDLIEQHHRRLTTFVGYSEAQVVGAEARLGVQFPEVFRTFLREMGRSPGELFSGSDLAGVGNFMKFRALAIRQVAASGKSLSLPREAVVFMFHQGYVFGYLLGTGGFDSPVLEWMEDKTAPVQVAATFGKLIDAQLNLMESNHRTSHEQGGHYLTLNPDGSGKIEYPAPNSGNRPLKNAPKSG